MFSKAELCFKASDSRPPAVRTIRLSQVEIFRVSLVAVVSLLNVDQARKDENRLACSLRSCNAHTRTGAGWFVRCVQH